MNIIIIIILSSCYIRYIYEYVYDRMRAPILQYTHHWNDNDNCRDAHFNLPIYYYLYISK